jgi:FlaA1/EpsC-like NDP-sugar epimerase
LLTGFASLWFSRRSAFSMGERVLIIGAGQGLDFALWLLRREPFRPIFSVVGIEDDDPLKQGMRYAGAWVVGTSADISSIVKQHDVGLIMLSVLNISADDQKRIFETCIQTDARLLLVSDMMRSLHMWLTASKKSATEFNVVSE